MSAPSGLPERSEAAPYYFGYIDRIKGEDVVGVLEQQLRDTLPRLGAVSEEQSLFRYEPGKWSIRELLGHVSDAEQVPWSRHVDEFRVIREATVAFFRNLPDEGWKRSGTASGNVFTTRALAYIIAGHLEHHLAVLRERYLR